MRIFIALGLMPLALLAGCQSDEQILAEARKRGLEQCNNSAAAKQAAPGFDVSRFCTCLMDKTLNGKSVAEIENMSEGLMKSTAERNGAECAAQQMPAAAAPATQQATEGAAEESVEEAADEVE